MNTMLLVRRCLSLCVLAALPALVLAQAIPERNYTAPRTAFGQPDLQGVWSNAVITPLERPAELGDKAFFAEGEAETYEQNKVNASNRDRRTSAEADILNAYNDIWWDSGTNVVATRRTSLITAPANGKIPARTPAALARQAASAYRGNEGPEAMGLSTRCIHWSIPGPPMLPGSYNNNYQIVQTEDYVLLVTEMGHETRIIPLDGRAAPPASIRQWMGVSRGHWEGETLVVDTSNFNDQAPFQGSSENMKLTERFTRMAANILLYEFTVDDPESFAEPWSAQIPSVQAEGQMYEYACHEGNRGLSGVLNGARLEEKQAEDAKTGSGEK